MQYQASLFNVRYSSSPSEQRRLDLSQYILTSIEQPTNFHDLCVTKTMKLSLGIFPELYIVQFICLRVNNQAYWFFFIVLYWERSS